MPADLIRTAVLGSPAPEFTQLTYRGLARHLETPGPPNIAVGAWAGARPVGLVLGYLAASGEARLESIMVAPPLRRLGAGLALLDAWEQAASATGASAARLEYAASLAARVALERLLAAAGWAAPELHMVQIVGHAGAMAEKGGAWRGVGGRLLKTASIAFEPWDPTRPGDVTAIERLVAQPDCGPGLDPRRFTAGSEPAVSVALRRDGEIVGWVLGQRSKGGLGPGAASDKAVTIYYPVAYCDSAIARTGPLIAGYHHAFSRQAELFGPESLAVYRTHPGAPRMLAFTLRRFSPIALRTDEVFASRKVLAS